MEDVSVRARGGSRSARLRRDQHDQVLIDAIQPSLARTQRIAFVLTNNQADAEELVAEAVARMLPHWRNGVIDNPGAYLRTTVVRLASRRWQRRTLGRTRDRRASEWVVPQASIDQKVVDRDATFTAIARLPPRRRAIVVLRYYDDLSLEQIAGLLQINVGTVKSQLSRALEQLRDALADLKAT